MEQWDHLRQDPTLDVGSSVAFTFVALCLTCKYSANAFEATLGSPAKGQWLSIKVLQSWKSCWITCEPTHPLLWNRRRLTKLADGTQSAPRPPDFPAEVSGPTPRTFITQDSSASSVVSHFPQYNGCCLPARPPLICPYSPLSCLTSNPVLFVCFFVCFPVLWPVVLLFPGENRAPQKEDINQRLMSS